MAGLNVWHGKRVVHLVRSGETRRSVEIPWIKCERSRRFFVIR